MIKIFELLDPVLSLGLEVSVFKDIDNKLAVNLNTDSKSECILEETDGIIIAHGRYGRNEVIEDYGDLIMFVDAGKCGRDYISSYWETAIRKFYEVFA